MSGRRAGQAYLALVVLTLSWSYSWIAVKIATHDASPIVVAAGRSALGAVTVLAFIAVTGRSLRPPPFLPTLVLGLLQTTGFTLLVTIAVSTANVGKTAILAYTMPFWLALLAWPLLGERITPLRSLALALAAAGLVLIVTPLQTRSTLSSALAVLGGFVWAASAVYAIRLRSTGRFDLLALTGWQMVWGSLALAPFALVLPAHARFTGPFILAIAFCGVFASGMGWALWLFILSRLPATVAGVASLATPVVGVAMAALQLHEVPSRRELLGMALIVTALVVNSRAGAGARVAASAARPGAPATPAGRRG